MSNKQNAIQKNSHRAKRGLKPKRSFFSLVATVNYGGEKMNEVGDA